jgi:hypothetical protein
MSPTTLLNVTPDLMRARAEAGLPATMGSAADHHWALVVGLGLAIAATLALLIAIH